MLGSQFLLPEHLARYVAQLFHWTTEAVDTGEQKPIPKVRLAQP